MQVSTKYIIVVVIVVTAIFFIVALFILLYVRLYNQRKKKHVEEKRLMAEEFEKQLLRSQIEVQENTLSVLSRELHDNIGQLLSTTRMILGMVERSMPTVPDGLYTAQQTLVQAIQELRTLSKTLNKEWLEQFSFIDNVKTEVSRIEAGGNIKINFSYSTGLLSLTAEEQIILFRIVQETIQNAIKHSSAKTISITLVQNDSLVIVIEDNGIGFDQELTQQGLGFLNMKERIKILGGTIQWESVPNTGTIVTILLPIK